MRRTAPLFLVYILAILFSSCSEDTPVGLTDPQPKVRSLTIRANPNNVVSAVASLQTENVVDVAIEYGETSKGFAARTPFMNVVGDSVDVPVLALRGATPYTMRAIGRSNAGKLDTGAAISFTTSPLPADLPTVAITTNNDPTPGYVMLSYTGSQADGKYYALVVNNAGEIVWYRKFTAPVGDFQKQPDGSFTVESSHDGASRRVLVLDPLGNVVREYASSHDSLTDSHEFRMNAQGAWALMGIDTRRMDLTAYGGSADALVDGMTVEYHRPGKPTFYWSTFDHLDVTDAASDINLTAASVKPWHGNAIEIDVDGNLLVSFRNSDAIIKINAETGAIIWRLGGKHNNFQFIDEPFNGFSHQHGIRRLANGNIILFDNGNGHSPPRSRGVEYRLDEAGYKAERVWHYLSEPPLYSFALGMADRAANGNTLLCYGINGNVIEVDPSGVKRWELALNDPQHYIYRAFRIESLY